MRLTNKNQAKLNEALSQQTESYFRILFDYRVEDGYRLSSLDTAINPKTGRVFSDSKKIQLRKALLDFIEETTNMSVSEVDEKYGRKRDENDTVVDIEDDNEEFPIDHYQLAENGIGKLARIHGYFRAGAFVVRRIDWAHQFHKKKESTN